MSAQGFVGSLGHRGAEGPTGVLKLNLACGPHILHGFVNLDKAVGWTFEQGFPWLPDGCVDGLTESHGLMYLPWADWPAFLAECARVLKPGGVLRITEDETNDHRSSRFGGFHDAVVRTGETVTARYLLGAGFEVAFVAPTETRYRDDSLIQQNHGRPPKIFHIEGVKP